MDREEIEGKKKRESERTLCNNGDDTILPLNLRQLFKEKATA